MDDRLTQTEFASSGPQHKPLYETGATWTWNTVGSKKVEINIHTPKQTITLSEKDIRQMQIAMNTQRLVHGR